MAACGWEHGIKVAAALHRKTKAARMWCLGRDKLAVLKLKAKDNSNKALVKEKNRCRVALGMWQVTQHTQPKRFCYLAFLWHALWGLKDINFCLALSVKQEPRCLDAIQWFALHSLLHLVNHTFKGYSGVRRGPPKKLKCLFPSFCTHVPEWWEPWRK